MDELIRELERRADVAKRAEHLIGAKLTETRIGALKEARDLARDAKRRMAEREPAWELER
jgi:hypothetical protein